MIIYLGINHPLKHIRGVENVILAQSMASRSRYSFLIILGDISLPNVYRWGRIIVINIKKVWFWPIRLNYILYKIKTKKSNAIIHSHSYLLSLFSLYKTSIFTIHDTLPYIMENRNRKKFYWRIIELFVYSRCRLLHFVSKYTFNYAKLSKLNKSVIKHNTQVKDLYKLSQNSKHIKKKFKYALIVRSLEERADLINLFNACKLIRDLTSLKFIVVGKGPLMNKLAEHIKVNKIDNVELVGYVDHDTLYGLYLGCEFTITTAAFGEGFGLPIIESYSFGKEAIASDVCAIPEIIRDKKFLFNNDSEDIARSILFMLREKKENNKIKEFYNKYFSLEKYIKYFDKLYLKISE